MEAFPVNKEDCTAELEANSGLPMPLLKPRLSPAEVKHSTVRLTLASGSLHCQQEPALWTGEPEQSTMEPALSPVQPSLPSSGFPGFFSLEKSCLPMCKFLSCFF